MSDINLSTYDEPQLCRIAEWVLSPTFELQKEVHGKHLVDGENVRIDYILKPKPVLLSRGFDDVTIGLEVKSPASKNAKQNAFAWQAITYAQSEFDGVRPAFVLMFPEAYYFWGDRAFFITALLQYGNVGTLNIGRDQQYARDRWSMKFASARYFSMQHGKGGTYRVATKRRRGNSS